MKENLEKIAVLRIIEKLRDGSITSSNMLGILNSTRKEYGADLKKVCATNKQRIVELVRKIVGYNLIEEVSYSGFREGRKPTKFSLKEGTYEETVGKVERYFSKVAIDKKKSSNRHKKEAVGKIIAICKVISETSDGQIKLDLLKELISMKTPVNGTLRNWSSMLKKEGIEFTFTAERGCYKFDLVKINEIKEKLAALYEKLSEVDVAEPKKRTPKPKPIVEEKELTEEEERIIYLLSKICDHKEVPYSQIWLNLKKQGITAGFDFTNLIRRSGLKKWFVQTKRMTAGGSECCLQFIGNCEVVGELMGQKINKSFEVRSSLEKSEMKAIMKDNFKLLNAKPGDNIYLVWYTEDSKISQFNMMRLILSFRGSDSFVKEEDFDTVSKSISDMMNSLVKEG